MNKPIDASGPVRTIHSRAAIDFMHADRSDDLKNGIYTDCLAYLNAGPAG